MKHPHESQDAQVADSYLDHASLAHSNLCRQTLALCALLFIVMTSLGDDLSLQIVQVARTGPSQLMAGKLFERFSDSYRLCTCSSTANVTYGHWDMSAERSG